MTTTTAPDSTSILRGGEWLLQAAGADSVFTPERLTDEHRMIARTAQEFVDHEVLPQLDRLEQKDWDLARTLVQRGGALGLLGVDVPEAYGGVGFRIEKKSDVRRVIEESLKVKDRPCFMDFACPPEENVMPMIPSGGSMEQIMDMA